MNKLANENRWRKIRYHKKLGRVKIIRQLSNGLYFVVRVYFNNKPVKDHRGFTLAIVVKETELKLTNGIII
ncbi:MAG: hypothetical protein V1709_00930 [Planctomycetota bacterium]